MCRNVNVLSRNLNEQVVAHGKKIRKECCENVTSEKIHKIQEINSPASASHRAPLLLLCVICNAHYTKV
jgi:hypothetical protein